MLTQIESRRQLGPSSTLKLRLYFDAKSVSLNTSQSNLDGFNHWFVLFYIY